MVKILILAGTALPIMLIIDLLWIGVIGHGFYKSQLGTLLRPDVVWPAAIAFYVIYAFALAILVLGPALEARSLVKAVFLGAVLGLAAYAAYDFSNLATLKGWPLSVTVVDLVWGTLFTSGVAAIIYTIASRFMNV